MEFAYFEGIVIIARVGAIALIMAYWFTCALSGHLCHVSKKKCRVKDVVT
ncbi:hypothetical protein [Nostoc piscinale]|nr:hypothetical protein [Nostoc piscinale]